MLSLVPVSLYAAQSAVAVIVPIFLLMCLHIAYTRLLMAIRTRNVLLSRSPALEQKAGHRAKSNSLTFFVK